MRYLVIFAYRSGDHIYQLCQWYSFRPTDEELLEILGSDESVILVDTTTSWTLAYSHQGTIQEIPS